MISNQDKIEIYEKEIINVSRNRYMSKSEREEKIREHKKCIAELGGLSDLNDSGR